jgi:hypothetical protein
MNLFLICKSNVFRLKRVKLSSVKNLIFFILLIYIFFFSLTKRNEKFKQEIKNNKRK